MAIASLSIGGRVEFAEILAGYNQANLPSGVNADAQIGAVVVGGDTFGFVSQEIGSFSVAGTKFPLTPGAFNDLAGLAVGITGDLRVREVPL